VATAGLLFLASIASAHAAGLGQVTHQSALGQPLDIAVELLRDPGEVLDHLDARVADPAAYGALGLERDPALNRTETQIESRDGRSWVHIRGGARVNEPILTVVIEINQGRGVSRRAYDLLLEPPAEPPMQRPDDASAASSVAVTPGRTATPAAPERAPVRAAAQAATMPARTQVSPYPTSKPAPAHAPLPAIATVPLAQAPAVTVATTAPPSPEPPARTLRPRATPPAPPAKTVPKAPESRRDVAKTTEPLPYFWLVYLELLLLAALVLARGRRVLAQISARVRARARAGRAAAGLESQNMVFAAAAGAVQPAMPPSTPRGQERASPLPLAPAARPASPVPALPRPLATESAVVESVEPAHSKDLYSEVAELIANALMERPERNDLRFKLMEVHHTSGSTEAFLAQVDAFRAHGGERDANWPMVVRMGRDLAPEHPLFRAAQDSGGQTRPRFQRFYDAVDQQSLQPALDELKAAYEELRRDPAFIAAFSEILLDELGRPTPLLHYRFLSQHLGGAQIHVKREDLRWVNSENLINAYGQALLARYTGKKVLVTASNRGAHGEAVVAAATALAMAAVVYVPQKLIDAGPNLHLDKMREMKAQLIPVTESEIGENGDLRRLALEHWLHSRRDSAYVSSLRAGPAPQPMIVTDFQAVIGQEVRRQWYRRFGELPDALVCRADAGYSTFGLLHPFLASRRVALECVERADGDDIRHPYQREMSWLKATRRVQFIQVADASSDEAAALCGRYEEFSPGPDNARALARTIAIARGLPPERTVVVMFV
jgi:tryptophan synthase beta subunit